MDQMQFDVLNLEIGSILLMFHMEFAHLLCHQVGRVLQKDFLFHLLVYFLLISEHLDNSKESEWSKKM